jgi:manganese/zinc/iron transport system permease protein
MNAFWIILTGSLVASSAGLLGVFLLLRRMSMLGDAISHAVLPGIVVAYLLSGSREPLPMLLGAAVFGVLATIVIESLYRKARMQSDAAIGVTFTGLFASGVILISAYAGQVDMDLDCVLFGEIAYVPLDVWVSSGGWVLGPRPVWILGGLLFGVVLLLVLGYKRLLVTTFNPAYASAIGISTGLWHYLLMGAVSVTTVVSFESVGAILVVAFLIVPPATAYLVSQQLRQMLMLTVLIGFLSAAGGYYLAWWMDGSIAGAMAVVAGIIFSVVLMLTVILRNRRG